MIIKKILVYLYKINRPKIRFFIVKRILRSEKGEPYSKTIRELFAKYHNIQVGMYTMGGCFNPNLIGPYTTFGKYCSVARGVFIGTRNHPVDYKSTHPFFFNQNLGYCKNKESVPHIPLTVGNDVWIGHNAIIMPHVKIIGDGAVIAAGAVVNKDVPPYAIVVGNPARVVRYRFSPEVIVRLLEEKWWEKDIEELESDIDQYCCVYEKSDENPDI